MVDAFEGAPRGSIRLTAQVVSAQRDLKCQAMDSAHLVDIEKVAANFNHVVNGDLEVDGSEQDYERTLEELDYRLKNATRFLNRIRNTAIKVARFRRTGSTR
jgi:hypothetical protein